jgi:hypothetical protein
MDYQMMVDNKLLISLKMNGVDLSQAIVFFGTQARCMMGVKPNYGPHRAIPQVRNGFKFSTHILKGYYPGTTTMFRMTMIHDPTHSISETNYFVKVTLPPIVLGKKTPRSERYTSDTIDQYIGGSAEHAIFGGEKPPIVAVNKLNVPKCISPRGMPVFKLQKGDK